MSKLNPVVALLSLLVVAITASSQSSKHHGRPQHHGWSLEQFRSLIVFGDSYSDESRLLYFLQHNSQPPPPGTLLPETFAGADGGRVWPRYIVQYTNQHTQLYDYAVSGGVCSNKITPRAVAPGNPFLFPDVEGYEVPAFLADKAYGKNRATGKPYFSTPLSADNAVYAIYIGTNDLGVSAFLQDAERPGYSLTDYMDCVWAQVARLYDSGARHFVLMNLTPLYIAPLYANTTLHGVGPGHYWPDKPTNHTWIYNKMFQYVKTLNSLYSYRTPYEAVVSGRFPGAEFALFDVGSVFLDVYERPSEYLNGTTPLHVTGFYKQCDPTAGNCTQSDSPDSWLWYDELHPSEQVERVIAKEFVKVLDGKSDRARYFSGCR